MENINQFDKEAIIATQKFVNDALIWGLPLDTRTEEEKYRDEIKVGIVLIDGKEQMINIHQEDMKAYKTGAWYSLELPLEEIKYDKFVRWARGMDF